MGKKRKGHKVTAEVYDSDDERTYKKEKAPDTASSEFFNDEIDDFHDQRDKVVLDRSAQLEVADSSSDEEVLAMDFDDGDDEDDAEMDDFRTQLKHFKRQGLLKTKKDSDDEDDDEEEKDKDDRKTWGKKRTDYYGGGVKDDKKADLSGSEPDDAELEEEEALAIQKKMEAELDEADFNLDLFKQTPSRKADKETKDSVSMETVVKDLSKLTKKEKIKLIKKESPELIQLVQEFKDKMKEITEVLVPIQELYKHKKLSPSNGMDYVETKLRLCLNYCVNINFYIMLKAKRATVDNHPVIKRILQYRNLLNQMSNVDKQAKPHLDSILKQIKEGEEFQAVENKKSKSLLERVKERRELASRSKVTGGQGSKAAGEEEIFSLSTSEEEDDDETELPSGGGGRKRKHADDIVGFEENEEGEEEDDERRGITYQIEKNKGLTPNRKKEYRNPRVRHRMKFRKAKIRRKGKIREVRTETERYGGEMFGIRAGIKRGVKLN